MEEINPFPSYGNADRNPVVHTYTHILKQMLCVTWSYIQFLKAPQNLPI